METRSELDPMDPATAGQAPEGPPPPVDPLAALEAKTQEAEQLTDRLLRLQAEFDNFRKRAARERAEFAKFAAEGLLLDLLPTLDNLERARAAVPAEGAGAALGGLVEGIDMILRLFRSSLEKHGVTPLVAVGQPFDPTVHQAVAQVEVPEGEEEHQVVEEVQAGYLLHGRVLRPAMVKVSRRGPGSPEGPARGEGEPA